MLDRRAPQPIVVQGPEGEPGQRGPAGRPGRSAYDLACDAGFSGTRAQWLESLKGKDGAPGIAPPPQIPIDAVFERDDDTELTRRVLVRWQDFTVAITPHREDGRLMTSASFAKV